MERDDPVMRLLPADEDLPRAFREMRPEEQRWRARLFLAAWIMSGGFTPMAWSYALQGDPSGGDYGRQTSEAIDESLLISEVRRTLADGKQP